MPKARLTWQWKVTIGVVISLLFLTGWLFSPQGHIWMKNKILESYELLPNSEQRDSSLAGRYLALAWWAGSIRGDVKEALSMYENFCGLGKDKNGNDFTTTGKLVGLCSPDGKTGWGPLHPRAPEAHWAIIQLMDTETSASEQFVHNECFRYYRLFYTWVSNYGPTRNKAHPRFRVYWNQILLRLANRRVVWPVDLDRGIPLAPPLPKEE